MAAKWHLDKMLLCHFSDCKCRVWDTTIISDFTSKDCAGSMLSTFLISKCEGFFCCLNQQCCQLGTSLEQANSKQSSILLNLKTKQNNKAFGFSLWSCGFPSKYAMKFLLWLGDALTVSVVYRKLILMHSIFNKVKLCNVIFSNCRITSGVRLEGKSLTSFNPASLIKGGDQSMVI